MKRASRFWAVALFLSASNALALDNFSASNLSSVTSDSANVMLRTIALGADHRAYMPATPQGMAIGLDVGVDLTIISIPSDFVTALSLISGQATSSVPTSVPVPKFSFHKGLPMNIDLGFTFATSKLLLGQDDLFSIYGGEVKWAFISGGVKPSVAARLSGSYAKLWFLSTHTYAVDVVASKNLMIIDPYVGAGMKFWSGDLGVDIAGLPVNVSAHQSSANPHIFAGLPLKLSVLRLTFEVDYNLAGLTTYGTKVSLGF